VPTPVPTPTAVGDLSGKKVLYILAKDGYAVGCHVYSETLLKGKNAILSTASWTKEGVPVWGGGTLPPLIPDLLVSEVKAADFDAIIFECGTPMVVDDPDALRICQEAVQQEKVLAALCMMPAILATAGVLEGIKATSNAGEAVILQEKGAIFTGTAIEKVGKIITASYDGRAQFGVMIAEALAE
jgi:putative intracellular protease/amidase